MIAVKNLCKISQKTSLNYAKKHKQSIIEN
jgi:hypothetical protein